MSTMSTAFPRRLLKRRHALDAGKGGLCCREGLESQYGTGHRFHVVMVLFPDVVAMLVRLEVASVKGLDPSHDSGEARSESRSPRCRGLASHGSV
jgi:hypothetical protein